MFAPLCACLPPFAPQAVSNVNTVIGPAILGRDPTDQKGIDNFMVQELDGTKNEWGCVTVSQHVHRVVLRLIYLLSIGGSAAPPPHICCLLQCWCECLCVCADLWVCVCVCATLVIPSRTLPQ